MNREIRLKQILEEILSENYKTLDTPITLESHLKNDLGLDSLDLAFLTVKIEDEFDVDIFEEGVVFTFGDILQRLNE
jgi:acyl carrier protein